MEEGSLEAVNSSDGVAPKSQLKALQKQIRELERLLGKKTLENEILQDALRLAQEKNSSRGKLGRRREVLNESHLRSPTGLSISSC